MQSFKGYIIEMTSTAQQGFQYEINAVKVLKPMGIVPKNFTPAGAGSDIPDLMIQRAGKEAGCELKISPGASGGSLVIKYANGKWYFDEPKPNEEEKIFIRDLAMRYGVVDAINKKWKNEPYKFSKKPELRDEIKDLDKRAIYAKELKRFEEIKAEIPATNIEQYYNKKKTYYMNVGTTGFYLLGASNPLKFKGVPRFSQAATLGYRARVQAKGGGNYQFTFEMSIRSVKKSPMNIAPIKGKSVSIVNPDLDWYNK